MNTQTRFTRNRKPSHKKKIILAVIALVLIAGVLFAGYKYQQHRRIAKENAEHAKQEAEQNQQIKERTADRDKGGSTTSNVSDNQSTDQQKNDGSIPVLSTDLGVVINRVTHNNPGDPVSLRATVSGTTFGDCTVTFSKSGQSDIVKVFPVDFSAGAVSCGQADTPESAFPASGTWDVKVTVTSDQKISAPATSKVTVNK